MVNRRIACKAGVSKNVCEGNETGRECEKNLREGNESRSVPSLARFFARLFDLRLCKHLFSRSSNSQFITWECSLSHLYAGGSRVGVVGRVGVMCPGFDSRSQRHMWAEFVGSLLCSERFFSGNSGFPLSSKTNIWFDLIYLIYSLPN